MSIETPVIIDNFLDTKIFDELKFKLLSNTFDWYYNDYILYKDENTKKDSQNYQLIHFFYKENHGITSESFFIIKPILDKLNIKLLLRVKANLNPKTETTKIIGDYHIDSDMNNTTAIFYVNTNNGYTKFQNGKKVNSVSNRLVLFNSNLKHVGFSCTDQNVRVLININFFSNIPL